MTTYIGVAGLNAIAGPITVSFVNFPESPRSEILENYSSRARRSRHIDFPLIFNLLGNIKYQESRFLITAKQLNDSNLIAVDMVSDLVTRKLRFHMYKFDLDSKPDICYPIRCLQFDGWGSASYEGSECYMRNLAQWIARKFYDEEYRLKNLDLFKKYGIETMMPMNSDSFVERTFTLGPSLDFHRLSSLRNCRKWIRTHSNGSQEHKKIRNYKYRRPRWWKAIFKDVSY